jgi:hypothetical protein
VNTQADPPSTISVIMLFVYDAWERLARKGVKDGLEGFRTLLLISSLVLFLLVCLSTVYELRVGHPMLLSKSALIAIMVSIAASNYWMLGRSPAQKERNQERAAIAKRWSKGQRRVALIVAYALPILTLAVVVVTTKIRDQHPELHPPHVKKDVR